MPQIIPSAILPSMSSLLSRLLCALVLVGMAPGGWAQKPDREKADRDQPIEIDAGQVRIDGKRKVRLFSGGVEIRRGSLLIKAQQIEMRETADGEVVATALGSPGTPATFRQKRDGLDEQVEGQAQKIDYDGASETVRLEQLAQLRRWMGGKLSEDLSGQLIVYDQARDSFEVLGQAPSSAVLPASGSGRVRAVVAPRSTAKPAAGKASEGR
jgi:lipopolysaccharide export system protein LptA